MDEVVEATVAAPFFRLSRVLEQLERGMHPADASQVIRDVGSRIAAFPSKISSAEAQPSKDRIRSDELELIEARYRARRKQFIRACLGQPFESDMRNQPKKNLNSVRNDL